jgi:molybdate transport system ATP-binding protein
VLLFPHMTVRGNLLYGRRASGPARLAGAGPRRAADAERDRPDEAAAPVTLGTVVDMLGIDGLLHRRVPELSGGERQRVALGRALMTAPALLLMDEPLAAVDRARRERILPYLLRVRRELHVPLVYVTHDAGELAEIADRVLVVVEGRLVQAGAPGDVLARR